MDPRYFRSVGWLFACTGLGYGLLKICSLLQPKESELFPGLKEDKDDRLKYKRSFVDVLNNSSNSEQPFYRMTKAEIDRELNKK